MGFTLIQGNGRQQVSSSFKTHLYEMNTKPHFVSPIRGQQEAGKSRGLRFERDQHSAVSSVCFTDNTERHKEIERQIKRKKKSYRDRYFARQMNICRSPWRQERQDCPDWHWRNYLEKKRKENIANIIYRETRHTGKCFYEIYYKQTQPQLPCIWVDEWSHIYLI